ncbi:HTH-type transcriptional activator CmpR [Paracoccus haematequi]|jgi:DNA-binding transcriptional LysR family regulator|uniref:Transcriptional regulator n=2 Tax=Paracoccus TaxID=265 RepID=A0A2H5F566_9RHOB|nr:MULTISPECIES: LysR substrate-binding domain-containing protein [Paracoccus]AUH66698.1 transcriptional regulator [Paracoccus zhejiangensis]VDS10577.1 HTH-type transcriptional activator CmpR [Paracoccus haematequi]
MARTYRQPTLRQIEVFKAVIETGTVSRAAETLNMSQPAASKLLSNLEADTGLDLFERRRGLLIPTERGQRFYEEVDRIFSGLDQIALAIDNLRSEERGRLTIGVLPALSGRFISTAIRSFSNEQPEVFVSLHARSSQFLVDWMRSGKVDVCIVAGRVEDPHIQVEPILNMPMVCMLPPDHPLMERPELTVSDLATEPLVAFMHSSYTRLRLERAFEAEGHQPRVVTEATTAQNVCELVAAGMGIALVHPIYAETVEGRVSVRPFVPDNFLDFQLCRLRHGRNRRLVATFVEMVRATAKAFARDGMITRSDRSIR